MPTDISNRIKHSTTVDFVKRTTQRPVHIVQYDNSLPILEVSLKNNGIDYDIPNDISDVRIRFGKPDRTFVINSMLDVSGGNNHTVYFELTRQMTVFPGTFHPVVELIKVVNDEDTVAASGYIEIEIDRNPVQDEYVESTVEYKSLVKYAEEAEEAAESAEESSEDSEAWAIGKRNGTPVSSSDPTYHNNSKWYSDNAQTMTSGKADKDIDSVTGNLAEFDSSHNPVDSGVHADKVMLSDGSYSEANVGTSDNLVDKLGIGSLQEPFFYRPTAGGDISINEEGTVQIKSIHGKTFVWNQICSGMESGASHPGGADMNATVDDYGYLVLNGTADSNGTAQLWYGNHKVHFVAGHWYYMSISDNPFNATWGYTGGGVSGTAKEFIKRSSQTGDAIGTFEIKAGQTYNNVRLRTIVVDLTAMFGAGNEPETVADLDFRKWFPDEFYPFSEPHLLNFTGTGIKSVGFNQLDLDSYMSTLGITKTGEFYADTATNFSQKSLNVPFPIKWLPNTKYCFYIRGYCSQNLSNFKVQVYYTDGSFQAITLSSKSIASAYGVSDPAKTIREVRFSFGSGGSEYFYLDSLCVSFSYSAYRDGEYEPYWSVTRNIPVQQYFPTGMKSAGTVFDELTPNRAITRIASINLHDIPSSGWSKNADHQYYHRFDEDEPGAINTTTSFNVVCSARYTPGNAYGDHTDRSICTTTLGVWIYDEEETGNTPTLIPEGATLYYPVGTPIETRIDPPLPLLYKVADFGTEEVITPTGTAPTTSPLVMVAHYNRDYTRQLDNIVDNIGDGKTTKDIVDSARNMPDDTIPKIFHDNDGSIKLKNSSIIASSARKVINAILGTPEQNGTYILKATVTDGYAEYSWEATE